MSAKINGAMIRKQLRLSRWMLRPSSWKGVLNGPKVLINSVPKSGTNVLQELVQSLPLMRGVYARTVHGHPDEKSDKLLSGLSSGQCATSHLWFGDELEQLLLSNNIKTLHVVRDFRDSLLSQVEFLDKLGSSHRHGKLYEGVNSFDDRLNICLYGVEGVLKGWKEIVPRFDGWLESSAMIIRYEDLIDFDTPRQHDLKGIEIEKITKFIGIEDADLKRVAREASTTSSFTYNKPGVNKWKNKLSESQVKRVNQELGDSLIRFGYEVD